LGSLTRTFIVGSVFLAIAFLYALIFLRETLVTKNKSDQSLLATANPLRPLRVLLHNKITTRMSILMIFINLANQGFFSSAIHYNTYRFNFDRKQNGAYMMLIGIGTCIVQGVIMRRIIPRLGEMRVLLYCYYLFIFFFIVMGYTDNANVAYALALVYTVAGMSDPIQQGLISKEIRKEDQGMLQGGISSLMLISKVVASLTMSAAFRYFTSEKAPVQIPGIAFYIGSVLAVVSTGIVMTWPDQVKKQEKAE
jgi:DHA1 family tetracycline resistance protein-like MFS transporter